MVLLFVGVAIAGVAGVTRGDVAVVVLVLVVVLF